MLRKLTAGVVLAVVVAGTADAAGQYLITSTTQIKPKVLKALRGARGPRGTTGASGGFSTANVTVVHAALISVPGSTAADSVATCPTGSVVIAGGIDGGTTPALAAIGYDEPLGTSSWEVVIGNLDSQTDTFGAVATCARSSSVVATATSGRLSGAQRATLAHQLASVRAAIARDTRGR
jgi:hypothetical protein